MRHDFAQCGRFAGIGSPHYRPHRRIAIAVTGREPPPVAMFTYDFVNFFIYYREILYFTAGWVAGLNQHKNSGAR